MYQSAGLFSWFKVFKVSDHSADYEPHTKRQCWSSLILKKISAAGSTSGGKTKRVEAFVHAVIYFIYFIYFEHIC